MSNKIVSIPSLQEEVNTLYCHYTFDNFVVGKSNQSAYSAAQSAFSKIQNIYNPIFISGTIGVGKTHLLHAIGHSAYNDGKVVIYTTIERFMNDFTDNSRNLTMDAFRNKYRTCDVLLIDDIQYLANKFHTQEELYHIFNELYLANKQIVVTANILLEEIDGLEDRLKSRLGGGLITEIGFPEKETKIAIIKKKSEMHDLTLTNEIIDNIVTTTGNDIREIESQIINLTLTNH
jgi:chromosomal replication initiator protein